MLVAKKQMRALALDDERIERGKNVHRPRGCFGLWFQNLRARPMLLLAGALDHDGNQLLAANALLDQTADCGLARRVEMADRIQADDALRAQRPIEQVDEALRGRGRLRRLGPAEVPL